MTCSACGTLNEAGRAVTDIHDFRAEHFDLSDYHPNPAIGSIPVATLGPGTHLVGR